MLGAIRRQLRLIGYYSAPRRRDRRTIIFERTTLAALLLCIPVTMLVDRTVRRATATVTLDGTLLKEDGGDKYYVSIMDADGRFSPDWPDAIPVADFDLTLNIWHYGWPITTSRSRAPAEVKFTPFGRTPRTAAALAADPVIRAAFEDVLRERGPRLGAVTFDNAPFSWDEGRRAHTPIGWIYAVAIWFALLTVAIVGPMMMLEFLTRVRHAAREVRSASRRDRGLCAACGYDLTGNVFSERCPECGTLV